MIAFVRQRMTMTAALVVIGLFLSFAIVVLTIAAHQRGIWLDEFWSLWMSRNDLGLADAAHQRWFQDTNPPFYYMAAWLFDPIIGDSVFARRMLNLIPLTMTLAAAGYVGRFYERARRFAIVLGVVVIGAPSVVLFFAEHRSYFSQVCFAAMLAMVLYVIEIEDRDFELKRDEGLASIGAVAVLFCFNLNQVAALISGFVLAAAIARSFFGGRRRWAAILIGLGVVSALPLLAAIWAQAPYLKVAARDFWIETDTLEAILTTGSMVKNAILPNVVAFGAAALVTFAALRQGLRRSKGPTLASQADPIPWGYVWSMTAALALVCAVLIGLNAIRPLLVSRYLMVLAGYGGAVVAAVCADLIFSRRWLFALFLANGVVLVGYEAYQMSNDANWEATARVVRAQVKACPGTLVYAVAPNLILPPGARPPGPPNALAVQDWSYRHLAALEGFKVIIDHPTEVARLPLARGCPTLLWSEHYQHRRDPRQIALYSKLAADDATLARVRVFWTEKGFVLIVPPAPASAPLSQ
jgi:hypothetical protein